MSAPTEPAPSNGAPRSGARYRPADRLRKRFEFQRIQSGGRRVHTRRFLILLAPSGPSSEGAANRLGLTVTRKVDNAVGRNRIKRVVREVFRRERELFPAGCDYVVIAKREAAGVDYATASAEIRNAAAAMKKVARRVHTEVSR